MTKTLRITTIMAMLLAAITSRAFTVTINIDNADAVTVTADGAAVAHVAGANTVTAEEIIQVAPVEGYALTRADDLTAGTSLLNYDMQKTAVTIRPYTSTGMGDYILNDGHEYAIETLLLADLGSNTLNVYVDDASRVEVSVGPTSDTYSSQNRKISLADGDNAVTFTPADKYVHVTTSRWGDKIYLVTFDGRVLPEYGGFYTYPLGNADASLTILVNNPDVHPDACSFTFNVDEVEYIKYFTNDTANKELIGEITNGDNTVTFTEGHDFSLWSVSGHDPVEVTVDGQQISLILGMFYKFTPADGAYVKVTYNPAALGSVGIDTAPATIYNLQGIPMGSDPASLPQGIYIINGHKLTINK